jgi:hypothetical protein
MIFNPGTVILFSVKSKNVPVYENEKEKKPNQLISIEYDKLFREHLVQQ